MIIRILLWVNAGHLQSEGVVDWSHPVRVTPGEVIIDRSQMASPSGQGIKVKGQSSYQGLALAGPHLGNPALMEDNAAQQLHIIVALPDGPLGSFTDSSEGFRQNIIKRTPRLEPCPEPVGPGTKPGIIELLKLRLEPIYPLYERLQTF